MHFIIISLLWNPVFYFMLLKNFILGRDPQALSDHQGDPSTKACRNACPRWPWPHLTLLVLVVHIQPLTSLSSPNLPTHRPSELWAFPALRLGVLLARLPVSSFSSKGLSSTSPLQENLAPLPKLSGLALFSVTDQRVNIRGLRPLLCAASSHPRRKTAAASTWRRSRRHSAWRGSRPDCGRLLCTWAQVLQSCSQSEMICCMSRCTRCLPTWSKSSIFEQGLGLCSPAQCSAAKMLTAVCWMKKKNWYDTTPIPREQTVVYIFFHLYICV